MREKDFTEVMTVLGNELRLADAHERSGLKAAAAALIGHARQVYPQIDVRALDHAFQHAVVHGWKVQEVQLTSQERFGHPAVREPSCIHSPEGMNPGHPMSACQVCRHSEVLKAWVADWRAWYEANPDHPLTLRYGPKVFSEAHGG